MLRHRIVVGVALVAAGLVINPWVVGWLAADDGSIKGGDVRALLVFLAAAAMLGGAHSLVPWAGRLLWGHAVTRRRAAAVIGLVALVIAGTYWRVASYRGAHRHTELVAAGHAPPTPEQQRWAADFYQRSLATAQARGWFDIENALAQGFQPDRVNRTHYPNLTYMFDDVILDPERPEWLVYDDSPDGKVLMALMFFTRSLDEVGPTPGGGLAQWHYHPYAEVRCAVEGLWTVGTADARGQCAEGVPVTRSPEMLHVWFMDHPLGRYTEMQIVPDYRRDQDFDVSRLHPIAVHFAIGLFVVSVFLDLLAAVTRRPRFHWAAWINLALGAVAAAAAVAGGMGAEALLRPTHEAHQTMETHRLFGFGSLAVVLLLSGWRFALRGAFPQRLALLYLALGLAGVGVMSGAGYYGGQMVYEHGAGVRAIDRFTREAYWNRVREVYRGMPPGVGAGHAGHQ